MKLYNKTFYRKTQKIEFRNAADLSHILLTHSVAPHEPGKLCTTAPSALLYDDKSKTPREVHWLELSWSKPKAAAGKRVTLTEVYYVHGMCFVQDGDKQLLVVASHKDVLVFNAATDKLEWKVDGGQLGMEKHMSPIGITTDGHGHLFVADSHYGNRCIQMFSASDGQYLGRLIKDEELFGIPGKMYWCDKTSSLVVLCELRNKYHLKRVKVHY